MKHVIYASIGNLSVYESQFLELLDYRPSREIKVTLSQVKTN